MGYRNDKDALVHRRDRLVDELAQIDVSLSRATKLAREAKKIERDLQHVTKNLERTRSKVSLPLLSKIRIAAPCSEKWDGMEGSATVRHCGSCDKKVFDLSSLTATEAEAVLAEHQMNLCVRFFRRRDGTVMTSDCAPGVRRRRRHRITAGALGVGLSAAAMAGVGSVATMGAMPIDEPCIQMMGEPLPSCGPYSENGEACPDDVVQPSEDESAPDAEAELD